MKTKELLIALLALVVGIALGYLVATQYAASDVTSEIGGTLITDEPESGPCLLALSRSADPALRITGTAGITSNSCNIHINSSGSCSFEAKGSSSVSVIDIENTGGIYTVGGFCINNNVSISDLPVTGTAPVPDPYINLPEPASENCAVNSETLVLSKGEHTLSPGTYCGGLTISGNGVVTFEPGVYVMKNGPLVIKNNASVVGNSVGFYLTGDGANLDIRDNDNISLKASTTGPLAKMVFAQDDAALLGSVHNLPGSNAPIFEGIVYLPKGHVEFSGNSSPSVSSSSDCSVYIANTFDLTGSTNVVIDNTCSAY